MALSRTSKFNVFILLFIFSVKELAEGDTNYLSNNAVGTNEASEQSFYPEIPQTYFSSYDKYNSFSNAHKYVASQPESQIPIAVSPTEKTPLSPAYKLTLDTSKHATSQIVKPPQGNQVSYPYVYTLAKLVSSTAATYTSPSDVGNDYHEEIPKKYHYGYRVSNPHTGTEFGHSEVNDGLSARGYYHVLLPDGRLQNVKYWAGPSGYHATITYETQY